MCTETICKILLYVLNIVFFIAGGAILAVGIVALVKDDLIYQAVEFLTGTLSGIFDQLKILTSIDLAGLITANAIILVVVGGVLFGIGFLGCCGACKKNSCMLTIYSVIVLVVCGAQIGVAVYAVVDASKLEAQIKDGLTIALDKSYKNGIRFSGNDIVKPQLGEDIAWDYLQLDLQCCAVNNFTDYSSSARSWNATYTLPGGSVVDPAKVPPSCCKIKNVDAIRDNNITGLQFTNLNSCMTTGSSEFTNQAGCYASLREIFTDNQTLIIAIFCLIVIVEIIAVAAACILKAKGEK